MRAYIPFLATVLAASSALAAFDPDNWDPNNWDDVVAARVALDGAKTTKECLEGRSYCITITTSPADEHGIIRQMLEYTGTVAERWVCTIDRGSDIRLCGIFGRPVLWRAEKRTPDGHFVVVKTGTIEEVYDALGWPTH